MNETTLTEYDDLTTGDLLIAAAQTPYSQGRIVEIKNLPKAKALHLAETMIVELLRTTGGKVTVHWVTTST